MAVSFDGVNDYIDLGVNASINGLAQISILAWMYPNSYGAGNVGPMIWKGTPDTATFTSFELRNTGGSYANKLRFVTGDAASTGDWTAPFASGLLGAWRHVVLTYDTTATANNPKIYLDGSSLTVTKLSTPSNTNVDTGRTGRIGALVASGQYFNGKIGPMLIFNRILSSADVSSSYTAGRTGIYTWAEQNNAGLVFLPNMNMATGIARASYVGATLLGTNKILDYTNCNQYTPTNSPVGA